MSFPNLKCCKMHIIIISWYKSKNQMFDIILLAKNNNKS